MIMHRFSVLIAFFKVLAEQRGILSSHQVRSASTKLSTSDSSNQSSALATLFLALNSASAFNQRACLSTGNLNRADSHSVVWKGRNHVACRTTVMAMTSVTQAPAPQKNHDGNDEDSPKSAVKKVALFGATGNLGVHVLRQLHAAGHEVTCFVRSKERFDHVFQDLLSEVVTVEGDACDQVAVDKFMSSARFEIVVSTAGCVDNSVSSKAEAIASPYCRIFKNVISAAEKHLTQPRRAIFVGGITALCLPGVSPPAMLQQLVGSYAPQYIAHVVNHERLCQSKLDWTLWCPGYMVSSPASDEPLRLSTDVLPAFTPHAFHPWQLRGPLKLPFVFLRFARRQGEFTVPYASVAALLVTHLPAGDQFSRARVGMANPLGKRLKKSNEARAAERSVRAARDKLHEASIL